MTLMDELSAAQVLASYEREYELAEMAYLRARSWDRRVQAWERQNDLARTIRGHCAAYRLVPAVDVGALT